jgi:hypothetical protein
VYAEREASIASSCSTKKKWARLQSHEFAADEWRVAHLTSASRAAHSLASLSLIAANSESTNAVNWRWLVAGVGGGAWWWVMVRGDGGWRYVVVDVVTGGGSWRLWQSW